MGLGLVAGFLVIVLAFVGSSALPAGAPAYGNYGLFLLGHGLCLHRHSFPHRQPMGIHWDWIFLRPRRVQEYRRASIRNESFFVAFV